MTLNHLHYGVLSTYEWTFFFRRVHYTDKGLPVLEVSNPIPQANLVKSLVYLTMLARSDYHFPCNPQLCNEPVPLQSPYVPTEVALHDFKFDKPVSFGNYATIIRSLFDHKRENVYKIWDASKDPEYYKIFEREIKIYEYAARLQGSVIPVLKGSYIASGFVLVLQVSDCGRKFVDKEEMVERKSDIRKAYRRLHKRGILHGDVADRNLVIGRDNAVRIVDFELSKTKDEMSVQEWVEMLRQEICSVEALFK